MQLTPKQRLLAALRFYATGSVYWNVADSEHVSKGSIWMCVNKVTNAINKKLDNIKWPNSVNECQKIATDFFNLSKGPNKNLPGFPLCIGAIDGTLINIIPPSETENEFVDRHSQHSLNVQGVAGPNLKFYSMNAKWPGSVNDARCFRNSALNIAFENGFRPFENSVLIGDSIYPVKEYLVPMRNYHGMDEFFRAQARCRRVIECCWGLFKNRFRCLHELNLKSPTDCGKLIMALGRLHNYIIETKEENENEFMPNFVGLEAEAEDEDEADEEIENPMLRNEMIRRVCQLFKTVNNI